MINRMICGLTPALSFLLAACLTAGPAAADQGKGAARRSPVNTVMVEQPHDALRVLAEGGISKATLVFLGTNPGISPLPGDAKSEVVRMIKGRDWDGLLMKGYPTSKRYPVNPFNFVLAAHRAGLVEKVYWVPPAKKPVGEEDMGFFKSYLHDSGVPDAELDALRQTDYSIDGTMNGVPVYVYGIKDLPKLDGGPVVMVDLSFFLDTYENEVKTPFLDMFGGLIEILKKRLPAPSLAIVSHSTTMGPVPLEQRFMGGYLNKYFTDPAALDDGPLRQWVIRGQAMYFETFYQTEDTVELYEEALKLDPDDASLHYDLSRALDRLKELDPLKAEIDRAVALDPGYYLAYLSYAGTFLDKQIPWAAEVCVKDALKVYPDDPRSLDLLYEVYSQAKLYDKAGETAERLIALGFDWPDNFGRLGVSYNMTGRYGEAADAYEKAIAKTQGDGGETLTRLYVGLATAYAGEKKIEEALKTYQKAMDSTDDPHEKMQIFQKGKALRDLWAPFMGFGPPSPAPPARQPRAPAPSP